MGFLDSYFKLTDMANELDKKSDVAASMSEMQGKLDGLNATMAAQVQPVDPSRRVDAVATVTSSRPSGARVGGASVVELELVVMLPAGIPLPVSHTTVVPPEQLARTVAGSRVAVSLDVANPATLSIDWLRAA